MASLVAITVAGVPGCVSRYCQSAVDHFMFGLLGSLGLPPDFENCSASFFAWLIIACTRSISLSGVGLFWAFVVRFSNSPRTSRHARFPAIPNNRARVLCRILPLCVRHLHCSMAFLIHSRVSLF